MSSTPRKVEVPLSITTSLSASQLAEVPSAGPTHSPSAAASSAFPSARMMLQLRRTRTVRLHPVSKRRSRVLACSSNGKGVRNPSEPIENEMTGGIAAGKSPEAHSSVPSPPSAMTRSTSSESSSTATSDSAGTSGEESLEARHVRSGRSSPRSSSNTEGSTMRWRGWRGAAARCSPPRSVRNLAICRSAVVISVCPGFFSRRKVEGVRSHSRRTSVSALCAQCTHLSIGTSISTSSAVALIS
mmetsp:Transcript_15769/g.39510  ORF Transcript_15769/g.39510 Transcript_15769/m.39510 type:complete len:243 (-) Transcript_15769:837-1565(-)